MKKQAYHEQAYGKTLGTLNNSNAERVAVVQNKYNPEWGTFRFNYKEQPLCGDKSAHTIGVGAHSKVLFENDMQHWDIISFK